MNGLKKELHDFAMWIVRNQKDEDLFYSVQETVQEYLDKKSNP